MTRDLRKFARQTDLRLLIGFVLLLFTVGEGLILFFYGGRAALMGLLCLVAGLAPLMLIWVAMALLEYIVTKANDG